MKHCTRCVAPSSHPLVRLDDGEVCSACREHERQNEVDWSRRKNMFQDVVDHARSQSSTYDCVIPVSGGKDSHWQVLTCLEHGLTPLTVSWKPPERTERGHRNLENLISLGVDHINYTINPDVERVFMRRALEEKGATGLPKHMAVFNIPLKVALNFDVPLVVWGENAAVKYGDREEALKGVELDRDWLDRYGVMFGTTAGDWVDEELTEDDLIPYQSPPAGALEASELRAVFLGYYFRWDPEKTSRIARDHGFEPRASGSKTGYYASADADASFISIHHFLKWYKFGYNRLFDDLSLEIRYGRISRDDAKEIIRDVGPDVPVKDIRAFCDFADLSPDRFFEICERFRNEEIWERQDGLWVLPDFLLDDRAFFERMREHIRRARDG